MVLLFAIACVLAAAACQTATGFGFALVLVPLLSLVIDVKLAIATSIIVGPTSGLLSTLELWREVRWRIVLGLLLGSVAGAPVGTALLVRSSGDVLRVGVAVVILASVVLTLIGLRLPRPRHPLPVSLGVGALSGVLRSATSMGGPPAAIYLLGLGLETRAFVATNAAYYLLGSAVSIAALVGAGRITGRVLLLAVVSLPALVVGSWCGRWLRVRASERVFRLMVLTLLSAAALAVLAPTVVGLVP